MPDLHKPHTAQALLSAGQGQPGISCLQCALGSVLATISQHLLSFGIPFGMCAHLADDKIRLETKSPTQDTRLRFFPSQTHQRREHVERRSVSPKAN